MEQDKKIKTSRASQTRVKQEKPKVWTPPSSLDAPPAPDGYRHRWIRAESMGQDDSKNMSGKIRSGWELVRADEYPDHDYPSLNEGRYAGVIGVGGLLLARKGVNDVEIKAGFAAYDIEVGEIREFLAGGWRSQDDFDSHFRSLSVPMVARYYKPGTFVAPLDAAGHKIFLWLLQDRLMALGEVEAERRCDGLIWYRLSDDGGTDG